MQQPGHALGRKELVEIPMNLFLVGQQVLLESQSAFHLLGFVTCHDHFLQNLDKII